MSNWIILGATLGLITCYYTDVLGKIKKKIRNYVINDVINHTQNTQSAYKIRDNNQVISVEYDGTFVHIPFKRELVRKMIGYQVHLITENGKEEVTQKPGIPYFFKADEMGGLHYELTKHGNIIKLNPDQLPFA